MAIHDLGNGQGTMVSQLAGHNAVYTIVVEIYLLFMFNLNTKIITNIFIVHGILTAMQYITIE